MRLLLLFLFSAAFTTPSLASGGKSSSDPYLSLDPPIVVNLQGARKHFMQVEIEAMSRDGAALKALEMHNGPLRHALIMRLSAQTVEGMNDVQIREQVRLQILEDLRDILEQMAGFRREALEAVYFTSLVIQ